MNLRTVAIIAAALVLLVLLAALGNRSASDSAAVSTLLMPELRAQLSEVDTVQIHEAGNEVAVTLERSENGWTVVERDSYRANVNMIREALTALADARIVEEKTSNPGLHDRLGVEDVGLPTAAGISISLGGEGVVAPDVTLGDAEGTNYRYARVSDEAQSYLIDQDPEMPRDAAQWLIPEILDVRGPRIERVTITRANGEMLDIFKSDVGQSNFDVADIPEGRELQYPGVANVIGNSLRDLRLEDVASLTGLSGEPEVVTEFQTFDGLVVRVQSVQVDGANWLMFDARAEEDPSIAVDSDSSDDNSVEQPDVAAEVLALNNTVRGWRYQIASYQHDQMTRRLEDLLATPASEEPEE